MKKTTKHNLWAWGAEFLLACIGCTGFMLIEGIDVKNRSIIIIGIVGFSVSIALLVVVYFFRPYKDSYIKKIKLSTTDKMKVYNNRKKDYIHVGFRTEDLVLLEKILPLLNVLAFTVIDNDIGKIYEIVEGENIEERLFNVINIFANKSQFESVLIFDGRLSHNVKNELKYLLKGYTQFFIAIDYTLGMIHVLINPKNYRGICEKLRQIKSFDN